MRYGVWIGSNIEFVRTSKFELFFRKIDDENIIETIFTRVINDDGGIKECIGICKAKIIEGSDDENGLKYKFAVRNIEDLDSGEIKYNDDNLKDLLKNSMYTFESMTNEGLKVKFYDGLDFELELDEEVNVCEEYVAQSLDNSTISKCLVEWILGTFENKDNGKSMGFSINTKKHMYIFAVTEEFAYCRAARYATCDLGVVFAQNIRVSSITNECHMLSDNKKAMNKVEICENAFNINACAFNVDGIYWSVKKADNSVINLGGCGGDDYYWKQIDDERIEWFKMSSKR